jgi:hypothetical protein
MWISVALLTENEKEGVPMKWTHGLWTAAVLFSSIFAGCKDAASEKPEAAKKVVEQRTAEDSVKTNLAKLDLADRKLAEAQRFCAVENENWLGSMGTPVKIIVKDQPAFLCCKSCQKKALADPDKTLAKVGELKEKSAETPAK